MEPLNSSGRTDFESSPGLGFEPGRLPGVEGEAEGGEDADVDAGSESSVVLARFLSPASEIRECGEGEAEDGKVGEGEGGDGDSVLERSRGKRLRSRC